MYRYKSLLLRIENGKACLYNNNRVLFIGFPYTAMKMMYRLSGDDSEVYEMFKAQFELREKPRFAKGEKNDN
jgi:hypothetical protein